jgi:hypothetical protein
VHLLESPLARKTTAKSQCTLNEMRIPLRESNTREGNARHHGISNDPTILKIAVSKEALNSGTPILGVDLTTSTQAHNISTDDRRR